MKTIQAMLFALILILTGCSSTDRIGSPRDQRQDVGDIPPPPSPVVRNIGFDVLITASDWYAEKKVKVVDGWSINEMTYTNGAYQNSAEMNSYVSGRLASGRSVTYHYETVPEKYIDAEIIINGKDHYEAQLGTSNWSKSPVKMNVGETASIEFNTSTSPPWGFTLRITNLDTKEMIDEKTFLTGGSAGASGEVK